MDVCRQYAILVIFVIFQNAEVFAEIEYKVVVAGKNVTLHCNANNTNEVTWQVEQDNFQLDISRCTPLTLECVDNPGVIHKCDSKFIGNGSVTTITCAVLEETTYRCESKTGTILSYNVTTIDEGIIQPPNCFIAPIFKNEISTDVRHLNLTCKSTVLQGVEHYLEINLSDNKALGSQTESITVDVNGKQFTNMLNPSCKLSYQDLNEHRTCYFPSLLNVSSYLEGNDAVFECDNAQVQGESVYWRLLDVDRVVDIENRSWTRDGGISMLLRDITNDDVGRIVECKIDSAKNAVDTTVGFAKIVDVPTNPTTTITLQTATDTTVATSSGNKDDKLYRGLTILFILLEVITISLIIANVIYIKRQTAHERVKNKTDKEMEGTSRSSGDGFALSNAECNENNSASGNSIERQRKNDSEDGTLEATNLQFEMTGMDNPVYFCVERSTPSIQRSCVGTGPLNSDTDDDVDGDRDRDSTGYDLVQIPVRTSVADTEHVIGPNNDEYAVVQRNVKRAKEKSIEDISQLYGKIKK